MSAWACQSTNGKSTFTLCSFNNAIFGKFIAFLPRPSGGYHVRWAEVASTVSNPGQVASKNGDKITVEEDWKLLAGTITVMVGGELAEFAR
jgi:hypothetical protein